MSGPIRSAKKFSEFNSFDQLAKALRDKFPALNWGLKDRSLGTKLGELNNGTTTWWRNHPDKAKCLAEFLDISPEDLGLHEKAVTTAIRLQEFPEFPPLDLRRDELWQIAVEELDPRSMSSFDAEHKFKPTLDHWLDERPSWMRRPPTEFDWLWVTDDLHRRLLAQKLSAHGPCDVVFYETLAAAAIRLSDPRPIIVVVERDGGDEDLVALAERPEDAGILVIAPFMWIPREETSSAEWMGWEARTGKAKDRRKFDLTAKHSAFGSAVKRWEMKKLPDWRKRLLAWVERRLNRNDIDTHFSAQAVLSWLDTFDPTGIWFSSTSDLMQLCHLVHRDSEKRLPKASDSAAGKRLTDLLFERAPVARAFLLEKLAFLRWESKLPWEGALSLNNWQELSGSAGAPVSRSDLEKIVAAKSVGERKKAADHLAVQLDTGNPEALLNSGVLREVRRGAFDYQHRTFVRLLIRDRLMVEIADKPVEIWALNCFDPTRRSLVDAALDALPMDSLVKAAHRLSEGEKGVSAHAIAAAEALFIAIAKRMVNQERISDSLHRVARQVADLARSEDRELIKPWSRPMETNEDQLAWVTACWSWSLVPEARIDDVPEWLFPGWAKELPEPPNWFDLLAPEKDVEDLSPALRAFWQTAVEWAKEIDSPAESWPALIVAGFMRKAIKGGISAQSAWWKMLIGQKWAEKLLLECCEEVGNDAASRLWPSFVMAEREVTTAPKTEESQKPHPYAFEYSRIRLWILQQLKPAEILSGLSKDDLAYLAWRPQTLPPEVRADLLLAVRDNPPVYWLDAKNFLERFGCHAVPALDVLLEHEVFGDAAAECLWRWNAERALALLGAKDDLSTGVRNALYRHCTEDHFPQALTLLENDPEVFDQGERQHWIRKYLPNAREHAVRALELLKAEKLNVYAADG
ncbi:MAG: hypothetical protein Q7J42_14215 [Sulfuritalea sp.]|nr:hypothetical protein [Sulfuritalea sp.]